MSIVEENLNPFSGMINNHPQRHNGVSRVDLLSKLIGQDLDLMSSTDVSSEALKHGIDELLAQINEARTMFNQIGTKVGSSPPDGHPEIQRDLQLLKKKVSALKSIFPFSLVKKPAPPNSNINWRDRSTPMSVSAPDKLMQNLNSSSDNSTCIPTFQNLSTCVRGLKNRSRICLICFLFFPENAIIKKSLLVCWAKALDIGFLNEPIDDLVENGLIQPVHKDTMTVGGYWMHPSVHCTLTNQNWLQLPDLTQWVYAADSSSEEDIFYDDPVKILTKKELRMLHLGNWQRSSVRHFEVEDPDLFFKDMAKLSQVRYISLRGISLITEIPKFIMELKSLEILDVKACHNLEVLPADIGNLWTSLTHLDMSECYFLEYMPLALSRLHNLRVLKGFVVGEARDEKPSCTLQDLLSLADLMKLNIYTSVKGFPDNDQLATLKEFKFLKSLTISWGGCSISSEKTSKFEDSAETILGKPPQVHEEAQPNATSDGGLTHEDSTITSKEISFNLEKLDLQCVPDMVKCNWFKPTNFKHLKNLYIRGGLFNDLCQKGGKHSKENQWTVEILRLKHLRNLEMDYSDLVYLFPKLICLESVECPNLIGFPCYGGVWKATTQPPPTTYL